MECALQLNPNLLYRWLRGKNKGMSVTGIVTNGVVVLPEGITFPEGSKVEVTPREPTRQENALPRPTKNSLQPRDEWERLLLSAASDCGVALSNEALSSEGLYD